MSPLIEIIPDRNSHFPANGVEEDAAWLDYPTLPRRRQ
jgi:hypothetical protein